MLILPALDLMGNACVRLFQGDFDAPSRYDLSPAGALAGFKSAGSAWAHVVDLDGAKAGEPRQHEFIAALAKSSGLSLQAAGGVRTREHIARLLDAGVARVVVGSLAVSEPETVRAWLSEFGPDRLTLAFDVRIVSDVPIVATHGWLESSGRSLDDALDEYAETALRHALVTDVARDGALAGPNVSLIEALARRRPSLQIQASGGVRSRDDITALAAAGAAAAIVGKALYEGRLSLEEAIDAGA